LLKPLVYFFLITNAAAQTLAQASGPRWEHVDTSGSSDANGNQYFVDTSGLKSDDGGIGATILVEFKDVQVQGGREIKSLTRSSRVDCLHRRLAVISIDSFTGARATGQAVLFLDFRADPLPWRDVEPGSVDSAIVGFICASPLSRS